MVTSILLILFMMILSAFFSGSEMAFIQSNKLLVEINRKKNPKIAHIIDMFMSDASTLIACILVGNNIALVVYGLQFNEIFTPYIENVVGSNEAAILLAQTILSTIIIIVTAEFLPKTIMQHNPTGMFTLLAMPLMLFYIIFYPIAKLMQSFAKFFITKILRKKLDEESENLMPSRVDLDDLLSKQALVTSKEGSEVAHEAKLMKNALDFGQIKVRDCMIPRTEIEAIEIKESAEALKNKFIETHYSKIMVYDDTIDNIVGYVHVSEMYKGPKTVKQMLQPVLIVPETMDAKILLKKFTNEHKSIALVVDEFGGTAGMLTIEDVLEEIFGEINDEHDTQELPEEQIDENQYIFAGRLEIDYLNDKYNIGLEESDDYDTLAGLILNHHHSIPSQGDVIEIDDFGFEILEASNARIEKVKLTKHS